MIDDISRGYSMDDIFRGYYEGETIYVRKDDNPPVERPAIEFPTAEQIKEFEAIMISGSSR